MKNLSNKSLQNANDEDKLIKDIISKEMLKRLEKRIKDDDQNLIRTLKRLLTEDDKKNDKN